MLNQIPDPSACHPVIASQILIQTRRNNHLLFIKIFQSSPSHHTIISYQLAVHPKKKKKIDITRGLHLHTIPIMGYNGCDLKKKKHFPQNYL